MKININSLKSLTIVAFLLEIISIKKSSFLRLLISFTFVWWLIWHNGNDRSICQLNCLKQTSFILCFVNGRLFWSANQYRTEVKFKKSKINTSVNRRSAGQIPWNSSRVLVVWEKFRAKTVKIFSPSQCAIAASSPWNLFFFYLRFIYKCWHFKTFLGF